MPMDRTTDPTVSSKVNTNRKVFFLDFVTSQTCHFIVYDVRWTRIADLCPYAV